MTDGQACLPGIPVTLRVVSGASVVWPGHGRQPESGLANSTRRCCAADERTSLAAESFGLPTVLSEVVVTDVFAITEGLDDAVGRRVAGTPRRHRCRQWSSVRTLVSASRTTKSRRLQRRR